MIDIHSHILPGVDDGAQTIDDSIDMARAAVEEGIHTILATPHHMNGAYINAKHDILPRVEELNHRLEREGIELTVLPGQETRINGDMLEGIEVGDVLPLNNTSYVFVEFPFDTVPRYTSQLLFDMQVTGYRPIIVHPERNKRIQEDPDILYSFVKKGSFTQLTAASVTGHFGKSSQKLAHQLIEANLAHLISSDAHNTSSRGFHLRDAYQAVEKKYGLSSVYFFQENAEYLIRDEVLAAEPPQHVKKKKFLGLF
ncbi:tyrosine protein phosphatase [Halobacillus locisalis]|uniref:Tyrosine-protein phosphatase n=1 Tax=Halobacillus locisalis TaxID=220753 RepID=A0A838CTU3_9BACI|nr:CpsB/CapC family capsule biosynthesis tyrosine phosphatase [Halobacillus locisalis]MBA2175351.1 tyrosine protein phosphatase [Halobacillus locisalis]